MTVSIDQQPKAVDPLASQKTELLGKLVAAQMALETAIGELIRSGASTSAADAQLSHLTGLQASIGAANAATLAAMGGEVASAIAQSKALADQAREQAAATAAAGSALTLAGAATASRTAVNNAMEAARRLQLTFASPADEAAYRTREDERTRYIAAQQAKHSPVGDLNASGGAIGQFVDARTHGAHGPEFDKQWSSLVATTEKLRAAAKANGVSTEEFDRRLGEDIRRTLKAKGLTDAEIDAQFAAHKDDPLETAKAYVRDDADMAKLQQSAERVDAMSKTTNGSAQSDVASLIASLQTAGVVTAPTDPASHPDHGVAMAVTSGGGRTI